jgi:HPr kinase/phosphorylase
MNPAPFVNHHCCVVAIGGAGVLIEGPSGAGKSSLALGLVDAARTRGLVAAFVADDQAMLHTRRGRLFAKAPPALAGLVEIRGYGIARTPCLDCARIDAVARLVEDEGVERMPDPAFAELLGVRVPLLLAPRRHEAQGVRIVLAFLAETRQPAALRGA